MTGTNPVYAEDAYIIGLSRGQYADTCAARKESSTDDFFKISMKKVERYEDECEVTHGVAKADRHELQLNPWTRKSCIMHRPL